MPNHCYNRVNVYSDEPKVIKEIHDIFEVGTNPYRPETVFGQIIPEPDWKKIPLKESDVKEYSFSSPRGEVGELPVESDNDKFGRGLYFKSSDQQDDRWYNWRVHNWGTKWDCYDLTIESDDEHEVSFTFNTAWSPPEEICRALKEKFEDASIQWFYDEPGMEFAGYL